jgi:hypothetical protein
MTKLAQLAGVLALACLLAVLIADLGPPWLP